MHEYIVVHISVADVQQVRLFAGSAEVARASLACLLLSTAHVQALQSSTRPCREHGRSTSRRRQSAFKHAPAAASTTYGRASGEEKDRAPGKPSHHKKGGGFINPWESFVAPGNITPTSIYNAWRDYDSKPVPPPEQLVQVVTPNWGKVANASAEEDAAWSKDIKSTWLGHACYLVEWPAPEGASRGPRILFDPVWSHRCSPSQWVGPARVTKPPFELKDMPHVDAVVISHNHYDHLDVPTIRHLYNAQKSDSSIHFFAPLGNAKWFQSVIGARPDEVTELDWWEQRRLSVQLKPNGDKTELDVHCTPCQHFTGRGLFDRNDTLWASWAITSPEPSGGSVWFAGDTGYRTVPRGYSLEQERTLPVCPAFKQIGERFAAGGKQFAFDVAFLPIGAYHPRWLFSRVHMSPEDAVDAHLEVRARTSLPIHFNTWQLTAEEMTEPPKRLRAACEAKNLSEKDFGICNIGETVRCRPQ